jgi:hypothetical protein
LHILGVLMKQIVLSYSLDGGTTWSTEYTFSCLAFWADLNPEFETDGSEVRKANGLKCQKPTARIKADIELSWTNFNPAAIATAADNWLFMQYWICAPLRRIWYTDGYTHFGWDVFDDQDNENYVNIGNWDYKYERAEDVGTGRKIRSIVLEIELREPTEVQLL